eukprot:542766-Pyramimonas_sp.AAC.3
MTQGEKRGRVRVGWCGTLAVTGTGGPAKKEVMLSPRVVSYYGFRPCANNGKGAHTLGTC